MPNDGGPAFPLVAEKTEGHAGYYSSQGMSLRDYFAAHCPVDVLDAAVAIAPEDSDVCEVVATVAYHYADAMLKARASTSLGAMK